MATMIANPAVLRIVSGTLKMTEIAYETGWSPSIEPFLWERLVGEDWRRIEPLAGRVIGSRPNEKGHFLRELHPGQVYEVRLYDNEAVDPTHSDQRADAEAKALGLLKGPGPSELIIGEENGPGGTFFVWRVETAVDTVAVLQVSTKRPVTDGEGFMSFDPASVLAVHTDSVPSRSHGLEVASEAMLPGNPFHALLLVIDGDGNWQVEYRQFTTRKRRVKVVFDEIHVINDGGNGHNHAHFTHWILQGDRLRNTCAVPETEITDRPSPGEEHMEHVPLGFHCGLPVTLGPEKITEDNQRLAILTRGVAPDPFGAEKAGNFLSGPPPNPPSDKFTGSNLASDAVFQFPIGSRRERVDDEPFEVIARPFTTGDELMYSVQVTISVGYV
jgi:hypothetical protein